MEVRIFDTTLRDGEQSPGAAMRADDRLRIATALDRAGVDVIEAGFPAASPTVAASVAEIAAAVRQAGVAALARASRGDIEKAWESIRHGQRPRIHTFIATSPIHMEHKLRMTPRQVLAAVDEAVRLASSLCADVEFSAEDATRSERDFLVEVFQTALDAGATTLNAPDTVGYTQPDEYASLIEDLRGRIRGSERAVFSVHCHDDLGSAVANSLAAVRAGAGQIECTVNGIGERAGNCAMEEVLAALWIRNDIYGADVRFDMQAIPALSRMVARATHMPVQKHKAVVGANAFAHESGIHQDGVLKHRSTYEILPAEMLGRSAARLHLGRQSGRHAIRVRLEQLGYAFDKEELDAFYRAFLDVANAKREVTDADLREIASRAQAQRLVQSA
ncbi:MAG TPA: 2-isopropylmalate synthase [Candidatus Dormibacteraeota bacterium]|nr:2-isopropylmalate synthase [Candidatus Dormibacteraeota bacterium]